MKNFEENNLIDSFRKLPESTQHGMIAAWGVLSLAICLTLVITLSPPDPPQPPKPPAPIYDCTAVPAETLIDYMKQCKANHGGHQNCYTNQLSRCENAYPEKMCKPVKLESTK